MDTNRWKRVEALFHKVLERPAGKREAFLREACGGDDELYNEVMELAEADGSANSLLDGRAVDAVDAPGATTLPAGTRIGPYRVIRAIGTGGMGVVYLAERADGQFEQRVALKLIKRGMDSDQILARFHTERRILAQLQHPNIANLLDGGMTDDGLPFFTMEFVDGEPITQYCDDRRLSIEARLDLFQAVCAAVQHAHGNLVVHRDLKPSNILVTNDGLVKLLDFGIARVLGEEEDGLTRSGQRVMTPAYASPEQVRGEAVTTATDVYSLGVVLYELLCGRHPHRDSTSSPTQLERAIVETGAERPSRFLMRIERGDSTDSTISLESIAHARRLSPGRLRRKLEGDIDNICLVALRKEPERRYSSPGLILEDVRRYLTGRPVSARPDTVRYRFEKFVRRNRAGVAAVAALVVLIAAGTVLYTTNLAQERDRARTEAEKAKEVSTFLSGLFEAADPYTSRGETISARQLLDAGRDRVHEELANQPDVLADMLLTIGRAYGNLGLFDDAVDALKENMAIHQQLGDEGSPGAVEGMVAMLRFMNEMGSYNEASTLGTRTVELARGLRDKRILADALGELALNVNYQGHWQQAERLYREAIDVWREAEGPGSPKGSPTMNDLALLLHEQSRYAEADSIFKQALTIQEAAFGDRHPETNTTRYNYAQLLADEGNLTRARAMWDKVLATDRALYPEGHPNIAFTLSAYGRLLSKTGEYEEAEKLQREALEMRRKFLGDENADVAYSIGSLGKVLYDRGRYDQAEKRLRESLALHLRINGPNHPVRANMLNAIGVVQFARGDYTAADTSFARSLEFTRSIARGTERHEIAVALVDRAAVLAVLGRVDEAVPMGREGFEMMRRLHGGEGMAVAMSAARFAAILLRAGDVAGADSLYAGALTTMRGLEEGAPPRPRDTEALLGLGRCRQAAGDIDGAERYFKQALDIDRQYLREGHPSTARAEIALAEAMMTNGDRDAARPLLRSAIDVLSALVLPNQIDLVEAKRALQS